MAKVHGHNAYVVMLDSAAASQNLSGDFNKFTFTESVNNPEDTAFGDPAVQRSASGLADFKGSVEGWYNPASNKNFQVVRGMKGAITVISLGPSGSVSGGEKISACVLIDDFETGVALENVNTFRFSFSLAAGSPTYGTW